MLLSVWNTFAATITGFEILDASIEDGAPIRLLCSFLVEALGHRRATGATA